MAVVSIVLVLVALVVIWLLGPRRPTDFVPGPPVWSWLGNIREVVMAAKIGLSLTFDKLADDYGEIFGLILPGGRHLVVIRDLSTIKSVFSEMDFSGRPDNYAFLVRSFMKKQGLVNGEGQLWLEQRRFCLRSLKDLGFGRSSIESSVLDEYQLNADFLRNAEGHEVDVAKIFVTSPINIIWQLVAGRRFDRDDPQIYELMNCIHNFTLNSTIQTPVNIAPWLRHFFPRWSGYKAIEDHRNQLSKYVYQMFDEHEAKFRTAEKHKDLIDSFLAEMSKEDAEERGFTRENSVVFCMDWFTTGIRTVAFTLRWTLILLAKRPEIQQRVHEELDRVLGSNLPAFSDQSRLPYCQAVIQEVHRWISLTPHALPHCNSFADAYIGKYRIPAGSLVFSDIRSIHLDKAFWGDPEVFRPERFLDSNGCYQQFDRVFPFGIGKRVCPAERLAKMEIFLWMTALMMQFSVQPSEHQPVLPQQTKRGFVNMTPQCTLVFTWRMNGSKGGAQSIS